MSAWPEEWGCWNCGAINITPDPPQGVLQSAAGLSIALVAFLRLRAGAASGPVRGVDVDVVALDAGPQQGVDLMIGLLVGGRDRCVADEHVPEPVGRTVQRRSCPT
ncbi:hypothetical protein ACIO6T_32910 [Streptomyces sp. NPDC087532]